jgi:predicted nucleic acid-binding protein
MRYLLDTNHLSAYCDAKPVEHRIESAIGQGHRFGVTVPVLCEYQAGILAGNRYRKNLVRLERAMGRFRIWPVDEATSVEFASIVKDLRAAGRLIPPFDILIASSARQLGLTLLTADRDFLVVPNLRTENWLV